MRVQRPSCGVVAMLAALVSVRASVISVEGARAQPECDGQCGADWGGNNTPPLAAAAAAAAVTTTTTFVSPTIVGVLYYRPKSSPEAAFEVGFFAALRLLEETGLYRVVHFNVDALEGLARDSEALRRAVRAIDEVPDVLLVKSNWRWTVDMFAREFLAAHRTPRALLISGTADPPAEDAAVRFYGALVYETDWYFHAARLGARHPNCHQAFGIDTSVMRPEPGLRDADKTWDLLFVGWMARYKRLDRFAARFERLKKDWRAAGARGAGPLALAVGKLNATEDSPGIVAMLRAAGVVVRPEVSYAALSTEINRAREVYIPSETNGGGERAVLEARACGVPVRVEPDNLKLQALADPRAPVAGHAQYATGLQRAIDSLL